MKGSTIFLSVLAAILVAAALIFGLKAFVEQNQRTQSAYADLVAANAKADAWIAADKSYAESRRVRENGRSTIDSTPTPDQRSPNAETPQETYRSLTITRPVELKNSIGRVIVKLQSGQSIQYTYRDNYVAYIRYDGSDYEIPISSTDLK